jgi:hypothetical protein
MTRSQKPAARFAQKANATAQRQRAIQAKVDEKVPKDDNTSDSGAVRA